MSFEVEGRLHKVFETENKTATFQAREFVIEIDGNYPQFVKFQLVQDRCSAIDGHNEGDMIKVHFDLRGREWQGRYFTNLNAWRIESANQQEMPPPVSEDASFPGLSDSPPEMNDTGDDLPF